VIFLMVMQKLLGILSICLRRKGVWCQKLEVWNRAAMVGLHRYLLICCVVGVFGRFLALETLHGAGERFSIFVVWFGNLSTFMLEMGVLFLYGLIIGIRWAAWWSSLRVGLLLILA